MLSFMPWRNGLNVIGFQFFRALFQPGALSIVVAGMLATHSMAAPAPVVVVEAQLRQLTPVIQVSGTVISRNDTRLAAQVEGRVTWISEIGSYLAEDELAAQLNDVLIRDTLLEAEAGVLSKRADVTFYAAEVKRLSQLARDSHAAQSRLDQAQRDLSVARSEIAAARARVEQAQEKLQRAGIRTPFAGVVTDRYIEVGEWADPGAAIVRLVDIAALEVRAWVPLTALPFIHADTELELMVKERVTTGKVRALVPVGDEQSRLYEMRLSLDDSTWSAGQGVRVAIPTAEPQSAVVIPRDALVLRRDGSSVFRILDDDTAERITVVTGIADGDWIAVSGGISPGDRVVVRGGERLKAGDSVSLTPLDSNE